MKFATIVAPVVNTVRSFTHAEKDFSAKLRQERAKVILGVKPMPEVNAAGVFTVIAGVVVAGVVTSLITAGATKLGMSWLPPGETSGS